MTPDSMSEEDLRAMVRESIARVSASPLRTPSFDPRSPLQAPGQTSHASHRILPMLQSGDDEGMCLIEPAVACNHCAYCLSYGH